MPSDITCVKSFDTIDLLPPLCKEPSIFCPVAPVPIVVTPWIYGDLFFIQQFSSSGPQPGSKLQNDPPVGLCRINEVSAGAKEPLSPSIVQFLNPVISLK